MLWDTLSVVTTAEFRRIALSLPGAEEGSHMGSADFRVGGRIFATLASEAKGYGNLMLTPEQQADFVAEQPDVFLPGRRRLGTQRGNARPAGAGERRSAGRRSANGLEAAGGEE